MKSSSGAGATHRVYGTLTLSNKMETEGLAWSTPIYSVTLNVAAVGSDECVCQLSFDLKDFVAPRQQQ